MKILSILFVILGCSLAAFLFFAADNFGLKITFEYGISAYFFIWGIAGLCKMRIFYHLGFALYVLAVLLGMCNIFIVCINLLSTPTIRCAVYSFIAIVMTLVSLKLLYKLLMIFKKSSKKYCSIKTI